MIKIKLTGKTGLFRSLHNQLNRDVKIDHSLKANLLLARLKEDTPVDTGEARDGWEIKNSLRSIDIQNEVPHIVYLNEGFSQQAPSNFIERDALAFGQPAGSIVEIRSS